MKAFIPLFVPFTAAIQACDLSGTGIFVQLSNGKFNYGPDYKLKSAKKNPATGQVLENPGKPGKSRARLIHKNDGDFSDIWVSCKKNKKSSYHLKCNADGTFEINGKTGDEITLPDCNPIGCDPDELGPFNSKLYEKADGCKKGYRDVNGKMQEIHGNVCFRKCGDVQSRRKIKCACEYRNQTCEYQIFASKDFGYVNWQSTNPSGLPYIPLSDCPTDPDPTDSDPTDPPVSSWGEWGEWNACSAGCGSGFQERRRECLDDTCQGSSIASQSCTGPDGADCPMGCKFNLGDFTQTSGKSCSKMFRGPDGFYLGRGGKCIQLTCDVASSFGRPDPKTWTCSCTNSGKCQLKVSGKSLDETDYTAAFDSVTDCRLTGTRIGDKTGKFWRWADGRRSTAQATDEVSGGPEWELMDICYNPLVHDGLEWKKYVEGVNDLPFANRAEWVASTTYGRVVETDDGRLVCRLSNKMYDWVEDWEMYLQLSVKKGQVSWQTSERHWLWQEGRHGNTGLRHPIGEYYYSMMVFQHSDMPGTCCDIEVDDSRNWPGVDYPQDPAHRALCRVLDTDSNEWYVGAVGWSASRWGHKLSGISYDLNFDIHCVAFTADGRKLIAKAHNRYFRTEEDNQQMLKSEYLVVGADDGSHWGSWSEWGECSQTCGWQAKRVKTLDCLDRDGNVIEYKNGFNCVPWLESGKLIAGSVEDDCEDDDNMAMCETWGSWGAWSECSETCDTGSQDRTRKCRCGVRLDEFTSTYRDCDEVEHPLIHADMCGDQNESTDSQECSNGECPTDGNFDGVGLGCRSDTRFMNARDFVCTDLSANEAELQHPSTYENEFGFVPHNYACHNSDQRVCNLVLSHDNTQRVSFANPSICTCHKGQCSWSPKRPDCSRGYEWVRLPVDANHPDFANVVDIGNEQKSAIGVKPFIGTSGSSGITQNDDVRVLVSPVELSDSSYSSSDAEYIIVSECDSGSLEWREGPYECEGVHCPSLYPLTDKYGTLDKVNDVFDFLQSGHGSWNQWSPHEFDRRAICRITINETFVVGTLIKYTEDSNKYAPFQCCPMGGDIMTLGCRKNGEYGTYQKQPYQLLYSGNCLTADMARWSDWSAWGECSKTACGGSGSPGLRSRTRTCINGAAGDLGCSELDITEMTERCNMAIGKECIKRCKLDVNFIDWYRFRLAHNGGVTSNVIQNSAFWQAHGVYYNRREDLTHEPRDWSGYFPEGSIVSGYRCVNPNTNKLFPDQHDAMCVCTDSGCDWDREMPICTTHETAHPGYTWTMDADRTELEGAFCVSQIFGGVGIVKDGKCHITMAMEPDSYYYDTVQYHDRPTKDEFKKYYKAFNTYYAGEPKDENEYQVLQSSCQSGLTWITAEEASLTDEATAVHLPSTYSFWHESWYERWERQRAFLCRMTYEDGKTCYGRFYNGTCNEYDNESEGYEDVLIEVLALDASSCDPVPAWSECSGEQGRPANCGPGTQTRTVNGVEESRTCLGTCEEMFLFETAFTHPDPEPKFACTRPEYPTHYNYRDEHMTVVGSPVFAKYPIRKERMVNMTFTCTGNLTGFWHTDYITGDEYYSLRVGEKCKFGCEDNFYKIEGVGYSKNIVSAECKGSLGKISTLQFSDKNEFPRCIPDFCIFPSFGKGWWANKQEGTVVKLGVACEGGSNKVKDNGDHVIAKTGTKCQLVCQAENGKEYRVDTTKDNFVCHQPLPTYTLESHGCPVGDHWNGKCVSDWISKGMDLTDDRNRIIYEYRRQTYDYPSLDMDDMIKDDRLNKCYKVQGDECPTEVPLNNDEIEAGMTSANVIYNCTDGNQPGSVCQKTCGEGFNPAGPKQTKSCECTKKCNWKGAVASCNPARCAQLDDAWWPSEISCFDKNDVELDWAEATDPVTGIGFPEGAYCTQVCKEHWIHDDWQSDLSTCECSVSDGRCKFDARKVNRCIPGVCSNDVSQIFLEFSLGFDYGLAADNVDNFDPVLECDNTVPADHPDPAVAGKPLRGSNCWVKCKEGFHFDETFPDNKFKMTCTQDWYHDVEWDVFSDNWDKYGDCDGDYGNDCHNYPQCIPDDYDYLTSTTVIPEEEFDMTDSP